MTSECGRSAPREARAEAAKAARDGKRSAWAWAMHWSIKAVEAWAGRGGVGKRRVRGERGGLGRVWIALDWVGLGGVRWGGCDVSSVGEQTLACV